MGNHVGTQELSREISTGTPADLPEVLAALPWLLGHFKAALRRHARTLAAEAAALAEATAGARSSRSDAAAGLRGSADFGFFAALLQPVLAGIEQVRMFSSACT